MGLSYLRANFKRMKTLSLLVYLITLASTCIEAQTVRYIDHLIPFKPSVYDELRPSLYRKLCVTTANCGRMIELPAGPEQAESAVSILCSETPDSVATCSVTATRAASNLDYIMQDRRGQNPLEAVDRVKVVRKDAPIEKPTALAVRAAWLRFLRGSRPSPSRASDTVWSDVTKIEFWLETGRKTMKAEIPDNPGKSITALVSLGRKLFKYCERPANERVELSKEIQAEARRLVAEGH